MSRLRIAMIGLGPAALPHAKSLVDLAGRIEVKWAASRSQATAEAFADQFSFPVTTDIAAAITDPEVQAVLVLTPANAHLAVAELALAAGKHVLVEKPLETTLARAEKLVTLARGAGLRLGVVLQHRFRPASLRLRQLLASGAIGTVEAASLRVPWWRPQAYYDTGGRGSFARDGGGVLLSQAIHAIDLFRSLLGEVEVLASQVRTTGLHRMEAEDYVTALMRLGNGSPASLLATTAAYPGSPETMEIVGSLGTATLTGGALSVDWLDGREERVEAEGKTGSGAAIMDFPHDAHRALIDDFADAISQDRDPVVTGEEALQTQRLIAALIRADPASNQPV
ncbi:MULTISPECIES: Gfo/Idh/MocA family protein [unclassified Mesorhizobium]|uniref:Gfo/Idh/MocA family protein n=1 Tax=unclassified Mesorhizobium TaxID=325217 RepID=UPI00112B9BBF|nr:MULTISPECIES: Gfo/Idh/MocA family oxidoreductase [unclassified Mesorhizobium]MBZ9957142.1 Gfo/Idh/MocA family oxidoreductase [Mesorhizobium sp. BR1-1-14]TPJ58095.1 Gfo/Idh/MocA family oxidoreductase [Mesorhizobium sp. B2-6-1]TPN50076.1 Gfo/Idh/MocA family oxidoreductase [Mesorhizobium sp. B1-1-4]